MYPLAMRAEGSWLFKDLAMSADTDSVDCSSTVGAEGTTAGGPDPDGGKEGLAFATGGASFSTSSVKRLLQALYVGMLQLVDLLCHMLNIHQ